jgi:deoxyribonuclease V
MEGIPHVWNLLPADAIALQKKLAAQVDAQTPLDLAQIRYVAGVDVSVKNEVSRAAIVVLSFPTLQIVETVTAEIPTPFPYIPGLLSFREGQVILSAHEKLTQLPDVYVFDGMGIMHPRRLGIASHIGLWLDRPTIGCGKTYLLGTYGEIGETAGDYAHVYDKDDLIGIVLRTKTKVKPVYISVGHRVTLDTARELILQCTTKYRLPEPIRAAHNTAGKTETSES